MRPPRWPAAALALALLAILEIAARSGLVSGVLLPPPTAAARALAESIADGTMGRHTAATLLRVIPGLLIGAAPGLLLGLAMGASERLRAVADPFVAAVHPLPKLALLPLAMLLLGIGEAPRIAVIAAAAFFPMLINAMAAVREIAPSHIELARNYGARRLQILTRVILPGSLPLALSGLRLAANVAFLMTVSVEMILPDDGLGALVWLSWQVLRVDQLWATLFVIGLLGVLLNAGLARLGRRLAPWSTSAG